MEIRRKKENKPKINKIFIQLKEYFRDLYYYYDTYLIGMILY